MKREFTALVPTEKPLNPRPLETRAVVAWIVLVVPWEGKRGCQVSITMARTRSKAVTRALASAQGAGYKLRWVDFSARRAPEYDHMFEKEGMFNWTYDHPLLQAVRESKGK
jgi:hypothetical protein